MPRTSLNPSELKHYTSLLQARETQLRKTIQAGLPKSSDKGHAGQTERVHDRGEESVADMQADLGIAQVNNAVRELSDVEAAKGRIADATYGLCIDCDAPIASARLQAYPAAKRCIACQTRHEDRRGGRDATPSL
jgi:DnaK suppressor protein